MSKHINLISELNNDDIQLAYKLHFANSKSKYITLINTGAYIIVAGSLVIMYLERSFNISIVIGLFLLSRNYWKPYLFAKQAILNQDNLKKRYEVSVSEKEIEYKNEEFQSKLSLSLIKKVVVTQDMILLYMNHISFKILPRRFFKTQEEYKTLVEWLERFPIQNLVKA
jgi:hypothetical protein